MSAPKRSFKNWRIDTEDLAPVVVADLQVKETLPDGNERITVYARSLRLYCSEAEDGSLMMSVDKGLLEDILSVLNEEGG